jgi:hypothetical protein
MRVYELEFRNGILYYKYEQSEWTKSLITLDGIKRFYEETAGFIKEKKLGNRPINLDTDGNELNWKLCNTEYCPLFENCKKNEKDFDDWINELKK